MKTIAILCGGGSSSEREVSLHSGRSAYEALKPQYDTEIFELSEDRVPEFLTPEKYIVFPLGHGEFMEDGGLQEQLELRGFNYAGSDAEVSRRCMNKLATKAIVEQLNIFTAKYLPYDGQSFDELLKFFQAPFVMKPVRKGSSVGVYKIFRPEDFEAHRPEFSKDDYFAEFCVKGKEITAGVLGGRALPLVEIRAKDGFYDYQHKYTSGMTEYLVPAPIPEEIAKLIQEQTERIFSACGCRDFARLDYLLQDDGTACFLEVNTIPGMTATSLIPKAAANVGIDYAQLCRKMIDFAIQRDAK